MTEDTSLTAQHANPPSEYAVTPVELFFDLAFVFGVSQLSRQLIADLSWPGLAQTLVLLPAVYAVWSYTSWIATVIPASRRTTQWMLLAVMMLGLFMNAAITGAFHESPWLFVVPLLAIQFGRTAWTLLAVKNLAHPVYYEHYWRVVVWLVFIAPLWIAGAMADWQVRFILWAAAVVIDLVGTWLAHPLPWKKLHSEKVPFDTEHMLERARLFLIVALGETVLTTGLALAGSHHDIITIATAASALVGTISLWMLGFGQSVARSHLHVFQSTDPILVSRHALNALMFMVLGLILIAVVNEQVIAHPAHHFPSLLLGIMIAGPVIFLAAQGWYFWKIAKQSAVLHVAGIIALGIASVIVPFLPSWIGLCLVSATLVTLAAIEARGANRSPLA